MGVGSREYEAEISHKKSSRPFFFVDSSPTEQTQDPIFSSTVGRRVHAARNGSSFPRGAGRLMYSQNGPRFFHAFLKGSVATTSLPDRETIERAEGNYRISGRVEELISRGRMREICNLQLDDIRVHSSLPCAWRRHFGKWTPKNESNRAITCVN